MWLLLAHYLYKERWDRKHKFPFRLTKENRQALEAYGEYWDRLIELCMGCHNLVSPNSSHYANASVWIANIIFESRLYKANNIRSNVTTKGKIRYADGLRKAAQALEAGENPEDEAAPNSFRLYSDAMQLRESSSAFTAKYWRPFIVAFRKWIKDIEKNPAWSSLWIEDGQLLQQEGKGKHKKNLTPKSR